MSLGMDVHTDCPFCTHLGMYTLIVRSVILVFIPQRYTQMSQPVIDTKSYISLVSDRAYCEAPSTDRVPKVSAKKCHFTPNWHKWYFAPPPPHPGNEKFADLEVSSQVGKLDFRFQSATLIHPSPPPKEKSWQIWNFQVKLDFWTKCHLTTPPPPPK